MPEEPNPRTPLPAEPPSSEEMAEILAQLEFFLDMDDADALPLEEEEEDGDEQ